MDGQTRFQTGILTAVVLAWFFSITVPDLSKPIVCGPFPDRDWCESNRDAELVNTRLSRNGEKANAGAFHKVSECFEAEPAKMHPLPSTFCGDVGPGGPHL
jgi:hypothetical protein